MPPAHMFPFISSWQPRRGYQDNPRISGAEAYGFSYWRNAYERVRLRRTPALEIQKAERREGKKPQGAAEPSGGGSTKEWSCEVFLGGVCRRHPNAMRSEVALKLAKRKKQGSCIWHTVKEHVASSAVFRAYFEMGFEKRRQLPLLLQQWICCRKTWFLGRCPL